MTPEPAATTAGISEEEITRFVVERFLPGVDAAELDPEYDLVATAVIDSLGVLEIVGWLRTRYGITPAGAELAIRNFRSVRTIRETARRAAAAGGAA